jgi:hypothetical protein
MDKSSVEQALSFNPLTDYTLLWQSPSQVKIQPQTRLVYDTVYVLKIGDSATDLADNKITKNYIYNFKADGPNSQPPNIDKIACGSHSEWENNVGINIGTGDTYNGIEIYFSQAMDITSVMSNLNISFVSGATSGVYISSFSWDTDKKILTINLAGLSNPSVYKLTVSSGAQNQLLIPLKSDFEIYFQT